MRLVCRVRIGQAGSYTALHDLADIVARTVQPSYELKTQALGEVYPANHQISEGRERMSQAVPLKHPANKRGLEA
jgi:hypothetical protein